MVEPCRITILIGIAAVVAAVSLVAAAAAVLRATRANGRGPWARALTALAAGWTGGAMVFVGTMVLSMLDSGSDPDREVAAGLGMWLLLVAAVVAVVASFLALFTRTAVREGGNVEVSRTLWGSASAARPPPGRRSWSAGGCR